MILLGLCVPRAGHQLEGVQPCDTLALLIEHAAPPEDRHPCARFSASARDFFRAVASDTSG
jgi:hypothetical protein